MVLWVCSVHVQLRSEPRIFVPLMKLGITFYSLCKISLTLSQLPGVPSSWFLWPESQNSWGFLCHSAHMTAITFRVKWQKKNNSDSLTFKGQKRSGFLWPDIRIFSQVFRCLCCHYCSKMYKEGWPQSTGASFLSLLAGYIWCLHLLFSAHRVNARRQRRKKILWN